MRYARTAILSAAATCLLALATPAIAQVSSAELGHPTGYTTAPTQNYDYGGIPVIGPVLGIGVPPTASALAPETSVAATPRIHHAKHRFAAHAEVR